MRMALWSPPTHVLNDTRVHDMRSWLTPIQRTVLDDTHEACICATGRQSGKTTLCGVAIVVELLKGNPVLYLSETIDNSYKIIKPVLEDICTRFKIAYKWRGYDFYIGSTAMEIHGLQKRDSLDKPRGHFCSLIVIDEFFSENIPAENMQYSMSEVLPSCTARYGKPKMFLIGTPPPEPNSYGEQLWVDDNPAIAKYHWTMFDNPGIPDPERVITRMCEVLKLDREHPKIQREGYGRFVYDTVAIMFPQYTTYSKGALPIIEPTHVSIGIDYGYTAYNTIIGVLWDDVRKQGVVFYEAKFNASAGNSLDNIKEEVRECWRLALSFAPPRIDPVEWNKNIWWWADCSDKIITDELRDKTRASQNEQIRLRIGDANKGDDMAAYDAINALLVSAALMIPERGVLEDEFKRTTKKRHQRTGLVMQEIDDAKFHPDAIPALRYALRNFILPYK